MCKCVYVQMCKLKKQVKTGILDFECSISNLSLILVPYSLLEKNR